MTRRHWTFGQCTALRRGSIVAPKRAIQVVAETAPVATAPPKLPDAPDFSVVLGGPLFQLYRRMRLSDDALELVVRRVVTLSLFAWLPLLLLSLFEGTTWSGVTQPFLMDVDVHARLLIALPLLVGGELLAHKRMRLAVSQFLTRGIVTGPAVRKFEAAESAALRVRDSTAAEILLVLFVYVIGGAVLWHQLAQLNVETWYRRTIGGAVELSLAGWWYRLVSLPLFQFILFRWYFRLGIWAWFLWKVSRCGLSLVPTHPDRSAGLAFVGALSYALVPFLMAHGTLFAGVTAAGIFFDARTLQSYWPALGAFSALVVLFTLGPLLVFVPPLARAKRMGLKEYGALAQDYVYDFDRKWLRGRSPAAQKLLGSADIQSLADLSNSYQIIGAMRLIPISPQVALRLVIVTLSPMAPLLLTVIPARELVTMLVKGLF